MQEHLKDVIRNTQAIRSLTTNPLLCAMLCALNRDRRQNLPSDRIELYEACCHMLAERRDKERRVAMQDYPQISYRQKRPLLEDLAYWFMTNGWSIVPKAEAEGRLAKRLANMPGFAKSGSGKDVMRLFIDRTGLLRESQPGRVDFTHRTFQEYFAAKAALDEGDIGVLIKAADEDQWREMIVLAAGLAGQKTREKLITGLIERGDNELRVRHSLHLLAVSCLETSVALDPIVMKEVEARLTKLVPPFNVGEASGLASAGNLAVAYLKSSRSFYAVEAAASIRVLAMIGTDSAFDAIATYAKDERQTVFNAMIIAWQSFDRAEFAKRMFSERKNMLINRIYTLEGFEHCQNLVHLWISDAWLLEDLGPISNLPKLETLRLRLCLKLIDLRPISRLKTLRQIKLSRLMHLNDFSPLAELPNLERITMDSLPEGARMPDSVRKKLVLTKP
jgi:hypothetical protein